jgi:transcriptional regulator with XRE-family HTH domain
VTHPLATALASQERSGAWLSRKTGKSPAYVTKVMNGTRRPSQDFKVRAAIALGTPIEDLFPPSAEPPRRRALAPEAATA